MKNSGTVLENNDGRLKGFFQRLTYNKYFHPLTIFFGLILICAVLSILTPNFLTVGNLLTILQQVSITTIMAFGMALIIISGGIDLSIGTAIVLISVPIAKIILIDKSNLVYIIIAIVAAIIVGCIIGFINGVNIAYLKIPAFIATLAMMQIARGLLLTLTGGTPVYGFPTKFIQIGGIVGGVPIPVVIMLFIFIVVTYLTERTVFGRLIYAIGLNEDAVRLSGINVKKMRLLIYTLGGASVGLGSVIFTARFGSVQPSYATTAAPLLFNTITAVILGGVPLSGGSGTMIGVLIGSIIIGVIHNGLAILDVNVHARGLIIGIIVILSILLSSLTSRRDLGKR